jgi:hypothetical protein
MKQAVRCLGRQAGRIYLYCIAEREWRLRLEYGRSDAAPRGNAAPRSDAAPGGDIR